MEILIYCDCAVNEFIFNIILGEMLMANDFYALEKILYVGKSINQVFSLSRLLTFMDLLPTLSFQRVNSFSSPLV